MNCIRPLKAAFDKQGDICYSPKLWDKAQPPFAFDCRKCLPCRLNSAREKAVRCWHESQMHQDNIFLTLTYDDAHLKSDRLIYEDWQSFFESLRERVRRRSLNTQKISAMVTGEYGDKNKRPHWHAIIFNYRPEDSYAENTTDLGHQIYTSTELTTLWGRGFINYGNVTIDSANYVARYAAKKLTHGNDDDHDFHPKHRTPAYGMGKSWIQKYWHQTFRNGYILLPNRSKSKIPRYYVDWLKKQHPTEWEHYVTQVLPGIQAESELAARKDEMIFISQILTRPAGAGYPLTRNQVKETILKHKFKQLQERLSL